MSLSQPAASSPGSVCAASWVIFSFSSFFFFFSSFLFFLPAAILEWFPADGWQAALAGDHLPG